METEQDSHSFQPWTLEAMQIIVLRPCVQEGQIDFPFAFTRSTVMTEPIRCWYVVKSTHLKSSNADVQPVVPLELMSSPFITLFDAMVAIVLATHQSPTVATTQYKMIGRSAVSMSLI